MIWFLKLAPSSLWGSTMELSTMSSDCTVTPWPGRGGRGEREEEREGGEKQLFHFKNHTHSLPIHSSTTHEHSRVHSTTVTSLLPRPSAEASFMHDL